MLEFVVGLHQRQMVKQPNVPLLCCYISSLSLGQFCNVCVRCLKREKNGHRTRMISTGVQRCCRLLMMYEVRRSVHQPAGRLLHPETPLSLAASVTSPSEDPSPSLHPNLLYTSQWLFSDTFHLCCLSGCLLIPLFLFLLLDQGLRGYWLTATSHISK